jgi:hypothetical protein
MNDYSEIKYGIELFNRALSSEAIGPRFERLLNSMNCDLHARLINSLRAIFESQNSQTYIACLSEHGNSPNDLLYGRLSMWRAYGGNENVALIFNGEVVTGSDGPSGAFVSPVLYADLGKFISKFSILLDRLDHHLPSFQHIDPESILRTLVWVFHFATISTKHPGFSEEREWRIIYSPEYFGESTHLIHEEVEIDGVRQSVYKMQLVYSNQPCSDRDVIRNALERILIGPTENPELIRANLLSSLHATGFDKSADMIKNSSIPFRRN